jgi:hypothetical protein
MLVVIHKYVFFRQALVWGLLAFSGVKCLDLIVLSEWPALLLVSVAFFGFMIHSYLTNRYVLRFQLTLLAVAAYCVSFMSSWVAFDLLFAYRLMSVEWYLMWLVIWSITVGLASVVGYGLLLTQEV